MKRVKIMLSAILVMAIVAGALAFKAKKLDGYCVYKTTLTTINGQEDLLTCKTVKMVLFTPTINGGIVGQSLHTAQVLCNVAPAFTPPANCTKEFTTINE